MPVHQDDNDGGDDDDGNGDDDDGNGDDDDCYCSFVLVLVAVITIITITLYYHDLHHYQHHHHHHCGCCFCFRWVFFVIIIVLLFLVILMTATALKGIILAIYSMHHKLVVHSHWPTEQHVSDSSASCQFGLMVQRDSQAITSGGVKITFIFTLVIN